MSSTPDALGEDQRLTCRTAAGVAQASLWWTAVPALTGQRLGVIGNFSADAESAVHTLLREAEDLLRTQGCTLAVGPMDGTTWRRYRFVTGERAEPPFFLEPANPREWPEWWQQAGYAPLAEYYSTATDDLNAQDPRIERVASRLSAQGVTIRPFQRHAFEQELERIYEVSAVSFQPNFLFTPLPKEAFVAQYRALQERVIPELILLAEHAGTPVGYVFTIPDFAQAQRGEALSTLIVKTLAVLPGRTYAGLGAWLLSEVQLAAARLGFKRAIHALMHESNASRNLSAHYARTIRRYTLFAKPLAP